MTTAVDTGLLGKPLLASALLSVWTLAACESNVPDGAEGPDAAANSASSTSQPVRLENKKTSAWLRNTRDPDSTSGWKCGGSDPTNVHGADRSRTGNWTKWEFVDAATGYVRIMGDNGRYLQDTELAHPLGGSHVRMVIPCDGSHTQWKLVDAGGAYFRLQNKATGAWLRLADTDDDDTGSGYQAHAVPTTFTGDRTRWKTVAVDTDMAQWEVYEESLNNPTYSGNPFDLVAKVIFIHTQSGARRTTEMFYDGSNTWKWRFNGEKQGEWTYRTQADGANGTTNDANLHGRSGTIAVTANSDPAIRGFLTTGGNRYAHMTGANGTLREGYLFNVWQGASDDFPRWIGSWNTKLTTAASTAQAYLNNANNNGAEIIYLLGGNSWFDFPSQAYTEHTKRNPDRTTFRVIETIIRTVHASGGRVHLWLWGDEARKWTPVGVGGINGIPDRRLQRYIAARLGPLPGWTAGYGFDNAEWVTKAQAESWASYMHARMGWPHVLTCRGWILDNSSPTADSYGSLPVPDHPDELQTDEPGGPFSYSEILADIGSTTARPTIYEERHFYQRIQDPFETGTVDFGMTMAGTRRALWRTAMAGGAGFWYGIADGSNTLYPKPEQLRTHHRFWHQRGRFHIDYVVDNAITNGRALRTPSNDKFVFYKENADSIQIDLSAASGNVTAVAVRANAAYSERSLSLSATNQTWNAPETGDWAVYVRVH